MADVTLIRCIGCGVPLGNKVPNAGALEHAATCPEHPLAARLAATAQELATLRAAVAVRTCHEWCRMCGLWWSAKKDEPCPRCALASAEERARRAEQALGAVIDAAAKIAYRSAADVETGMRASYAIRALAAPPPAATETPEGASHE